MPLDKVIFNWAQAASHPWDGWSGPAPLSPEVREMCARHLPQLRQDWTYPPPAEPGGDYRPGRALWQGHLPRAPALGRRLRP